MQAIPHRRPRVLAFLGLILVASYFATFSRTELKPYIESDLSKEAILSRAEEALEQTPLAGQALRRDIEFNVWENLLRYAQMHLDDADPALPVARWQIRWRSGEETGDDEDTAELALLYDNRGGLLKFEMQAPGTERNLSEEVALARAMAFLDSVGIDTLGLEVSSKQITREENVLNYAFTFEALETSWPELSRKISVSVAGDRVNRFENQLEFPEGDVLSSRLSKAFELVGTVLTVVTWVVVFLFVVVTFIRRVRHDELEFRRAVPVGLSVGALMFLMVGIDTNFELEAFLLGGLTAGLFIGGLMIIFYATAESLTREVAPEKLAVVDLLFRGRLRFQEMGAAVLHAIFLAGAALAGVAVSIWVVDAFDFGYLKLNRDSLWVFKDVTPGTFTFLFENVVGTVGVGVLLLVFWPMYLARPLQRRTVQTALVALSLVFAVLHDAYVRPVHVGMLTTLPLAWLVAILLERFDLLAIALGTLLFSVFIDLSMIGFLPGGILSAPGLIAGGCVGALVLLGLFLLRSDVSAREFDSYVPQYVSRIAERERFLKELEIARSVQMRFLPQSLPRFPSLDLASVCRPAMEVGGDYYDFILDGDRALGVVIGDVSGKGISAAFYMTMAKGIIRTLSKTVKEPRQILTALNEIFYENAPRNVFISVIYGLFDMRQGKLTFARAGHNPLIVRKQASEDPELLEPKGLAVGLEPGRVFETTIEEQQVPLEPGDLFVFYTDGISEAMNKRGEEFGESRLREVIRRNADGSASQLLEKISHQVNGFAGNTQQSDDFTMVVVKVVGSEVETS